MACRACDYDRNPGLFGIKQYYKRRATCQESSETRLTGDPPGDNWTWSQQGKLTEPPIERRV